MPTGKGRLTILPLFVILWQAQDRALSRQGVQWHAAPGYKAAAPGPLPSSYYDGSWQPVPGLACIVTRWRHYQGFLLPPGTQGDLSRPTKADGKVQPQDGHRQRGLTW